MPPLSWPIRLLIYALAVYRVTSLFCHERGPFDVFARLRAWAGIRTVTRTEGGSSPLDSSTGQWSPAFEWEETVAEGFWAELLNCPLCLSVWFSALAVLALYAHKLALDIGAIWLAVAAVSVILFNRFGGEQFEHLSQVDVVS